MLLHVLALLGSLAQAPAPVEVPAALAGADVRMVVQASWSHVSAENLAETPQLLLFSEPTIGFRAARLLAPGERVVYALPATVAPTFRMEAFDGPTPLDAATGSFTLHDLDALVGDAAFGVRAVRNYGLFGVAGEALERVETGASLARAFAAPHVPAPIPSEDRRTPTRRIEKRPLPPV